ncbi:MAG: phosphate signaling complex protein PhoU [Alphaproteobacteria bacterium]|nr:phosphate signaling complex protein PhoU [Alphaproteobacteria bacterium]
MTEHIVRAFEEELVSLNEKIARMGELAERQLADAVNVLQRRDLDLAAEVIAADDQIDDSERDIEEQVIIMIVRRQPMALDLREIMAAIRISSDLERVGDLAGNIAKRVVSIGADTHPQRLLHGVDRMSKLAMKQLKDVLDAYSGRDTRKAIAVWHNDEEIDNMYISLFREFLTYVMEDPRLITPCTHLLFAAKNMERIGDHATNIAETIHYLVHGKPLIETNRKLISL